MAATNNLVVRISAVDATSAAIDSVAKRLAGITAPVTKVTKSLARLSDASGVTRLSKAIVHLGGTAVRTSERFVGALGPLGALTAALSVGGFAKMTSDWARFSQNLSFDAARIGSGVTQLHALEGSARLAGSSVEAASGGIRNLQDVMTDAVGGRNNEALVYFRQLGVAFDDGRGHALRATEVLPKLADAISRIKDPSLQARVATQFFGGAAENLLPWLRKGSSGMAEYAELAKHYGVETEESAGKANAFRFAQERLTLAFLGLGNSISEKVSPPLSQLMAYLSELIARNRGLISDKFGSWAKQLGDWIGSIDWEKTTKYFGDLFDRFERWTDAMSKFTVPNWMKRMFGLGDDATAPPNASTPGAPGTPSGNGPITNDNPNAPGSPAFYKAHPEIKAPWSWGRPLPWAGNPGGVDAVTKGRTSGSPEVGQRMMGYFESQGWTHAQAAGIVANLDRESGFKADATGDSGQAYGAAQWHPDRQAEFAKWSGHDIRRSNLDEQMQFVQYELTHSEKRAGDILKAAPNASTAAYVVNSEYERPKDVAGENTIRGQGAERYAALPAMRVDVNIRGLPAGATAVATTTGGATGGVRVDRAMQ